MMVSFSKIKTHKLWSDFMPRKKEIQNSLGSDFYSIEIYSSSYFTNFNPDVEFEKWAAIEVNGFQFIPAEMETLIFPCGLYAVFVHNGAASAGPKTYEYIFTTWLTNSNFTLDNRPHFVIMGEKYKHEEPDSEEEIWIPIKPKYLKSSSKIN
jgi:AraC family transcriptional regulator